METKTNTYSLVDLTRSITQVIARTYAGNYWVSSEILKLNHYTKSGHCYPELVEKENGQIVAEIRSTIWKATYEQIQLKFEQATQQPLKEGMKVLFLVQVKYSPTHGIALNIIDIDPTFTLGALALEKQASIEALKAAGIFNQNKTRVFPPVPKKIAIISVETSKGYHDYLETIQHHTSQYTIDHQLFPAILQGDKAVQSILQQLEEIKRKISSFDVVLIVRGGGGDVGLHCYNHVKLAQAVAQFPIPVITGVGHSTNLTVTEMVAHSNQITPTAVANFILSHFDAVYQQLIHALEAIPRQMNWVLSREKSRLTQGILYLQKEVKKPVNTALLDLKSMESRLQIGSGKHLNNAHQFIHKLLPKQLQISTGNRIKQHQTHVQHLQEKLGLIDPNNVLKRGYSLTLKSNKVISESNPVQPGDIIITKNAHQQIQSTVTTIKPHE